MTVLLLMFCRYAAARGMLQAGGPALKELALGQMINMLQAAVKKGWILPGPSWRPARVTLTPAAVPQQVRIGRKCFMTV